MQSLAQMVMMILTRMVMNILVIWFWHFAVSSSFLKVHSIPFNFSVTHYRHSSSKDILLNLRWSFAKEGEIQIQHASFLSRLSKCNINNTNFQNYGSAYTRHNLYLSVSSLKKIWSCAYVSYKKQNISVVLFT